MKLPYFLPLLLLIFITSCKKEFDIEEIIEDDIVITAPVFVETAFFMKITGYLSSEGINATCTINNVDYKPDNNGYLFIPSILMNQEGQLVKIKAEGFLPSIFSVIPLLGNITQLKAMVFKSQPIVTFDAIEGGTFSIRNSEYTIPALSIVDVNGNEYSGTVYVKNYIRDNGLLISLVPSFSHNILVGDDGKNYSLQTWGGHDIFLYDLNGNEVFVDEGVKIKAHLKINSTIENLPLPNEFELMRFNEIKDVWKLDSEAKLEGDIYTVEISGLGHLRWSRKVESRRAEIKFNSENGPLTSSTAVINQGYANPISVLHTSDKGIANIYIPMNGSFAILVPSFCGPSSPTIINTYEDVTGNEDEILELKDFEGMEKASTIQGRIVDCNGNAVPNGIFEVLGLIKHYFISDENGEFSSQYFLCEQQEIRGQVYNPNTQVYSDRFEFEYIPSTVIDLGDQSACQ